MLGRKPLLLRLGVSVCVSSCTRKATSCLLLRASTSSLQEPTCHGSQVRASYICCCFPSFQSSSRCAFSLHSQRPFCPCYASPVTPSFTSLSPTTRALLFAFAKSQCSLSVLSSRGGLDAFTGCELYLIFYTELYYCPSCCAC